ncbi:conserved hypothetical protein (DUF159) [Paracholeplasma brassicae]|uniref:Abasic site processing protein n=1 Tax=Acholeplasma brassicae TaxID=61635 RepID=U4KPX6_9MOLU|nr:SOS response-associated peptidase [Paracholeplasma brassicae]CCV66445.1 conserved hypothetical protein (DUF159) [Paracholeplasma brassicae]
MCGRFTLTLTKEELLGYLKRQFDIDELRQEYILPKFNIAPTQNALCVIFDGHKYRAGNLSFGLTNLLYKENKKKLLNARSETIYEKHAFSLLITKKRCLIISDGYYEWDSNRQPYYFLTQEKEPLVYAGIYQSHKGIDGKLIHEMAILTKEATDDLKHIHQRMPLILSKAQQIQYLENPTSNQAFFNQTFLIKNEKKLDYYPVSSLVNSYFNDNPLLIERIMPIGYDNDITKK